MADQREGLAGREEGIHQLDRVLIFGEIPNRLMATGIEDGVVVLLLDAIGACRPVELRVGVCILLEPAGDVGLETRLVALGIERRAPAFGRCNGNLSAGILEDIIWRRQFLQPEAGLAPGLPSWSWEVRTIRTFKMRSFLGRGSTPINCLYTFFLFQKLRMVICLISE
jgi:hypothetical protein